MVIKNIIMCDVCGSKILVRAQVGFLPEHPIRIHCAKCGILISGKFYTEQKNITAHIEFENAKKTKEKLDINYYVEISGELLTKKIKLFERTDEFGPTPFMNNLLMSGDDRFRLFKEKVLSFLTFIKDTWPVVRRINELWINGKHEYLQCEIRKFLPSKQFPLDNELELLRGVHILTIIGFEPVLPSEYMKKITNDIFQQLFEVTVTRAKTENLVGLAEFFSEKGYLENHKRDFFKILSEFIEKFQYLIPAFAMKSNKQQQDYKLLGTTSATFDDVKHFYQDCFEFIGEVFPLISAYNNLKYRNDFNTMGVVDGKPELAKVVSIEEHIKQSKANRLKFGELNEFFNKIINLTASAEQRNIIGHLEAFDYDGINQIISYWPSCFRGKGEQKSLYLIEFLQNTLNLFETIMVLGEIIYQTQKIFYASQGMKCVSPDVFLN